MKVICYNVEYGYIPVFIRSSVHKHREKTMVNREASPQ